MSVDAVVYFNVIDAEQALCSVDDFRLDDKIERGKLLLPRYKKRYEKNPEWMDEKKPVSITDLSYREVELSSPR